MPSDKELNELSINILVDAKEQYTKELSSILQPRLYEGISKLYDEAENEAEFQNLLRNIPKWNQNIIEDEVDRCLVKSKCEWLHDLVCAVFISNTKILTAVRTVNTNRKINLKIPNLNNFMHNCYIECAREFYKNPFLMDRNSEEITVIDKQRNMRESLLIIDNCISTAIRKMLPFQQIIKKYLTDTYEDEIDISEEKYGEKMVNAFKENLYTDSENEYSDNDVESDIEDDSNQTIDSSIINESIINDNSVTETETENILSDDDTTIEGDKFEVDIEKQMESILNTATKKVEQPVEKQSETTEEKKVVEQLETSEEQPVDVQSEISEEQVVEQPVELQSETSEEQPVEKQLQEYKEEDPDLTIKNININVSKKDKKSFDNVKYVPNKDSSGNITYKEVIIEKKDSDDDINKTSLSKLTPKSVTDNTLTNQNEFKDNETEETNNLDLDEDGVDENVFEDVIKDNEDVNEEDFEIVNDEQQYQDDEDDDYDFIEESGEYDDQKYLDDIINLRDTRQSSLNTNTSLQRDPTRHMVRKKVLKLRKKKQPEVEFF